MQFTKMKSTAFFTNYSEEKFIDKLKKSIDTCCSFSFSVSFIKKPGLRLLAPNIEAALARGASGRIITSTYTEDIMKRSTFKWLNAIIQLGSMKIIISASLQR